MDVQLQKASGFVRRLLENRAIANLPALQKEEHIIQFLTVNARQIQPTLASGKFFPSMRWEGIMEILVRALKIETDQALLEQLAKTVREQIDFSFISFLQDRMLPVVSYQEELLRFLRKAIGNAEVRKNLSGSIAAVSLKLPDRYLERAFGRREYLHFELTKVQRLRMSIEEIKNLVGCALLLKGSIHILSSTADRSSTEYASGVVSKQYVDKVYGAVKRQLSIMPDMLLRTALNSSVSFLENTSVETTARIASVFAARGLSYRPVSSVDRGADTQDKSWFSIARKNYKYYGFDIKMLDEFYRIAAENEW